MSERSPKPKDADPDFGGSDDAAFEWMRPSTKTAAATTSAAAGTPGAGTHGAHAATGAKPSSAGVTPASGGVTPSSGGAPGAHTGPGAHAAGTRTPEDAVDHNGPSAAQPESRADRKAAEAAGSGSYVEPLPTSALHVRPPDAEVERRQAERDSAARAKPVLPRVFQVLLALFFPVVVLVLAVRAVTSPLFLWIEYNRPGFPGDGYGFSTDDRMTYGSYAVDYLSNWAGPRFLGDLVNRSGDKLFTEQEVGHMADVKLVILSSFGAGALLLLLGLVAILYLRKRSRGGVRRGLFAGSILTLVIIIGLATLAFLGWQQFFTEFHRIFFAAGTWTFALEDTLIRLFPGQFWIDAGAAIAGLVLLTALVTFILTWPTRRRRGIPGDGQASETIGRHAAGDAA